MYKRQLDNSLNPAEVISTAAFGSPPEIVFKSNPAENNPSLPVINKEPLSSGTSSSSELIVLLMAVEKTFAFPSSKVMIDTSPSWVNVAN